MTVPVRLSMLVVRPSTPIFELLENRYQARWIEEQKKADEKARKMEYDKVCSIISKSL